MESRQLSHVCVARALVPASSGAPALRSHPVPLMGRLCQPACLVSPVWPTVLQWELPCLICHSETISVFTLQVNLCPSRHHL